MHVRRSVYALSLAAAVALAAAVGAGWRADGARADRALTQPGNTAAVAGRFLIGFTAGYAEADARAMAERYGLAPDLWIPQIAVLAVVSPTDALPPGVEDGLKREPGVEYVEPDYVAYALDVPDDPNYNLQWAPPLIGAEEAWDMTTGDPDVVVAVLDTGIDLQHPDLANKFTSYGHDFANGDSDPDDDNGHGTHVGGIVGANTDNGIGVASVGRESKLMPIKVLDATGSGSFSWIASGITAAADHDADIINMSLGGPSGSTALLNAVNYAYNAGVLLIASSGNNGNSTPVYPAYYANVMAIGATNQSDHRASFSSYGSWLSMTGPGVSIYSSWCCSGSGGGTPAPYVYASGTSMAAPGVAAVAALILAADPSLTNAEVWTILETSAVDLGTPGPDIYFGDGRVNAEAAVGTAVAGGPTATPTPSPTPTPIIVTLNPVADAYVSSTSPDTNFGSLPKLVASSSPTTNSYLRFDASGVSGTVLDATLRVFAMTGSSIGYSTRGVADTTWGETTITFNNAPTMGLFGGTSGPVTSGAWTSANVTNLVSGGGLVSMALTSTDANQLLLAAREIGGSSPELIITYIGSGPTATVPATSTATSPPGATSTPLPTATNTPLPTATSTPLPTATNTPLPTATNTPLPTATSTPLPTATNTPLPTATNTPLPTATSTPLPTATNTPLPTATNTPLPTATNTPLPTNTATPAGPTATSPPSATPTATPATFTFTTEADAYVQATNPNGNFGGEIRLRTDGQPVERSFVRFNVQGLPGGASSATLKVYALTGSTAGFSTHVASSSAWGETTITFNNAPGFGTSLGSSGAFGGGTWISIDVTSAVTGNGLVTFVLNGNDANLAAYGARELSGAAAELIVQSP